VGDHYEITLTQESSSESSDESTASSSSHYAMLERVTDIRPDGLELEYSVPAADPPGSNASNWQFPARIFRPNSGPPRLVNRAEIEARLEAWLKETKLTRKACGRWIFTWTAIRIECDPQSAVEIAQTYDLGPGGLREGLAYRAPLALRPVPLSTKASGPEGSTFTAEMEIDPEAVRRRRIESDVAVGEISGKPVKRETAARNWAAGEIRGTISVTFDSDREGRIRRRTEVTKLEIRKPDGSTEKSVETEVVERKRAGALAPSL
jgi:hypothetical protein